MLGFKSFWSAQATLAGIELTLAIACAELPDQVRGYGPVKARSVVEFRQNLVGALHRFRNPAAVVHIQEVA